MQNFKEHIILKLAVIFLTAILVFPSIVKLSHSFENHKHEVCTEKTSDHHLHQIDVDCDFYKIKLNNSLSFSVFSYTLLKVKNNHKPILSQYQFISSYQRLGIELRGPPQFV